MSATPPSYSVAEALLGSMLHDRPHARWSAGPDGRAGGDQSAWRSLSGQSAESWSSDGWLGALQADDRGMAERRWAEALRTGAPMAMECRVAMATGGWRWMQCHAAPVIGPDGAIAAWAGLAIDVHERVQTTTALRESEERYRLTMESARDYAILLLDTNGVIQRWSPGAEAVFGWKSGEIEGRDFAVTFTPEDRAAGAVEKELAGAARDGVTPDIRWHLRADGRRTFIEGSTRALRDDHGVLQGFLKIGQDMTERRRVRQALQESEERFRLFGEASTDVLWIRDAGSLRWVYLSPAFERVFGAAHAQGLRSDTIPNWVDFILPEDRDEALAAIERVSEGQTVSSRYRFRRQSDAEVRWLVSHDFPIPDAQGRTRWIGGIAHDFTDEKATADRLQVLLAELQHRTRNLIGVIRAIATRTAGDAASLQSFSQTFTARLDALGRVNGLLSRLEDGDRVSFDELLRAEFAAHGVADENGLGDQVTLKGRRGIRLRSATIQTFGLALHELTTNAVKYGALSTPEGHVEVTWRLIATGDGEQRLRVEWRETGVPGAPASTRKGYGRELIERALPYQLAAETHYELGPDGVRCTITAPVSSTYAAGS